MHPPAVVHPPASDLDPDTDEHRVAALGYADRWYAPDYSSLPQINPYCLLLPQDAEAAIAQQEEWEKLAAENPDRFAELVAEECEQVPDWVQGDAADACETGDVGDAPEALPLAGNEMLYSGAIVGPAFCADMSLGGPRTYAFDSDRNGGGRCVFAAVVAAGSSSQTERFGTLGSGTRRSLPELTLFAHRGGA